MEGEIDGPGKTGEASRSKVLPKHLLEPNRLLP